MPYNIQNPYILREMNRQQWQQQQGQPQQQGQGQISNGSGYGQGFTIQGNNNNNSSGLQAAGQERGSRGRQQWNDFRSLI